MSKLLGWKHGTKVGFVGSMGHKASRIPFLEGSMNELTGLSRMRGGGSISCFKWIHPHDLALKSNLKSMSSDALGCN